MPRVILCLAAVLVLAPIPSRAGRAPLAIRELLGELTWGMSPEDAVKTLGKAVSAPLLKFEDQKTPWDVSVIEKEFAFNNGEAMLYTRETGRRRFLFFWQDKLYKVYIVFYEDYPDFKAASFEEFKRIVRERYGPDKQGGYRLTAIDQKKDYDSYSLSVSQASVLPRLERARLVKQKTR